MHSFIHLLVQENLLNGIIMADTVIENIEISKIPLIPRK